MKFFSRKLCRRISVLCIGAILLPVLLGLAVSADTNSLYYPTKMLLGEKIPHDRFTDYEGNAAQIKIADGQYTLVTYWSSWCSDCQEEFSLLPKLKAALKEYDNVQWYLIDRADGERETAEMGKAFIEEQQPGLPVLYDRNAVSYHSFGGAQIPTTLLLNPQGEVVLCYPTVIRSANHLRAMLDYAIKGSDAATYQYVSKNLLNADGTVKSSPDAKKTDSRAQSLLAEYAAKIGDTALLAKLAQNSGSGLGNDLRLLSALSLVKGFEAQSAALKARISKTYFPGNTLTGSVKLSDLDLQALELLGDKELSAQALSLVQKGYIGAQFPLYYSGYDVAKKTYQKGTIDMTESLMTVYHLAQQGKVKKQTIEWLRDAVENASLSAQYTTDGEPVARYRDETPGVYALTALIAKETGDQRLFTECLQRMEQFRTFNSASERNGSFSSRSSKKAFEQCTPLLVYAQMQD